MLQAAAAEGRFTAIVFALASMVYKAELAEETADVSIKTAVKQWQQKLTESDLGAAENICALARCCNVKAAVKAAEAKPSA